MIRKGESCEIERYILIKVVLAPTARAVAGSGSFALESITIVRYSRLSFFE